MSRSTRQPASPASVDGTGFAPVMVYTVLESAKLNGLDPETYLADVIDRMARGHPINRLAELLPWN